MESPSELHCSICFSIFFSPVSSPVCTHVFCRVCLSKVLEQKHACPLCRETFPPEFNAEEAPENEEIVRRVKEEHPLEFEERFQEAERERILLGFFISKKVRVGNEHLLVTNRGQNQHLWKFYIRDHTASSPNSSITNLIEKVQIFLHPTFVPPRLTLTSAPFEIQRVGWGTFEIQAKIFFKPELNCQPVEVTHNLDFSREDSYSLASWKFDSRLIDALPAVVEEDAQGAPPPEEDEPEEGGSMGARIARLDNLILSRFISRS